ncbi:tetratricopeptide repeat protein [Kiloniella laminariae]|uniref:Tetratricopeptide repeat protein n=1 Tax=Kiloniella laminariae TaxID=454162 RepID=A0ABT4LQC3_9PROT|nr:tetratricopeptide repeat protein [Kiloniella laminariae]MCZ4282132.1 tetratricopeptide repeat protein [Kiloniella laminariae]
MKNKLFYLVLLSLCLVISPFKVRADQKDSRLPSLFEKLQLASPGVESFLIEGKIWSIWLETEDGIIAEQMDGAGRATGKGDYEEALLGYTSIIKRNPNYAEAWNKRALTHYLMGNLTKSLTDINRTLLLEPRHFGALAGQGLIYIAQKKWRLARQALEKALAVHPTMPGPLENLRYVKTQIEGEEI